MTRPVAYLPDDLRLEIIEHCRGGLPNEACGLLAVHDGRVVKVYPTANSDLSPTSYTIPPEEHYAAIVDAEAMGWELGGVFHSHPHSTPEMSSIDWERALEPSWTYIVVGFSSGEPELRAYTL